MISSTKNRFLRTLSRTGFRARALVAIAVAGIAVSKIVVGSTLVKLDPPLVEYVAYQLPVALILVFEEARSLLAGNDVHGVHPPAWLSGSFQLGELMSYPWYRVFASVACIVVALGLYGVVNRTRLGMMIRAGASNRDMVRGLGIDIKMLYRVVFAGGVALAALAGMIAAPLSSVYPGMGGSVLIICFVVVVIGGIGSITGALVASLLVGFVDTFGKVFFAEYSGMGVYLLMAVILVWRPEGLMKRSY